MLKIIILATSAVIVIGGYVIWKQKNKKLKPSQVAIPKKWRRIGEVANINLFPLKSGKCLAVNSAECTGFGPKEICSPEKHAFFDRSFVVFDESTDNKMVTIRDHPKMLFIEVKAVDEDRIVFSSPGSDNLIVKIPSSNIESKDHKFVIMWFQEKVCTVDCGQAACDWFTKILSTKQNARYRLGYYARDVLPARTIVENNWEKYTKVNRKMDDEYMGSYSDLASYMIMTQPSLDDLNSRLDKPVSMFQFRPNLLVKGSMKPYEEDDWDWLKIGDDTVLRSFKKCTRCTVTTTNPDTGIRSPEREPLTTLKTYRLPTDPEQIKLEGPSPIMGLYMGFHRGGIIRVGDPVYVNRCQ